MRYASIIVTVLSLALAPAATAQPEAETPRVVAVKFHADWCGNCQAMGRVFEELQEKHDTLPVLFVTLDLTREHNRRQSAYLAHQLGLGDLWRRANGRTGFVVLVESGTGRLMATLNHQQTLAQMGDALTSAVGGPAGD